MAVQIYKKPGTPDYYEVGTNRYISATEFGLGGPTPGKGFVEVAPPTQQPVQPSVARNDQGGVDVLTNPLDQWKNKQSFLEDAKNIIRQKQGQNKDIQSSEDYWKTLLRTTRPFGATSAEAQAMPGAESLASAGQFNDERLRRLSPEDQASVQNARYAAATAHLSGLQQERTYRETRIEDVVKTLTDAWTTNQAEAKNAADVAKTKAETLKIIKDLGYDSLDSEGNPIKNFEGATAQNIADAIKTIESGGDYNARGKAGEIGAYQFMPKTWAAWTAEYLKEKKLAPQSLDILQQQNQDKIALWKIQQLLKDYTPLQVASIWNTGSPDTMPKGYISRFSAVMDKSMPTLTTEAKTKQEKIDFIAQNMGVDPEDLAAAGITSDSDIDTSYEWYKAEAKKQMTDEQSKSFFTEVRNYITSIRGKYGDDRDKIYSDVFNKYGYKMNSADINSIMDGLQII